MEANPYAAPEAATPFIAASGPIDARLLGLDWPALKRLRNDSHSIRALGALAFLGALVFALASFMPHESPLAGMVMAGFSAVSIATCYGAWSRPAWGRVLGMVACGLSMLKFPLGTLIGGLGLIALARGGRLFGPQRLTHREVVAAYAAMKAARKAGVPASADAADPSV